MTINLFQSSEYKALMTEHIFKTIDYLFQKNQEFAVACEIKHISFNPTLPKNIVENFDEIVLFVLSGYTFESASLDEKYFRFEAGFGESNFGSTVSVPLLSIKQLLVSDHPIILNLAEHSEIKKTTIKNSMESLINNPENRKLLKNKK